jgi:hypothetical protein
MFKNLIIVFTMLAFVLSYVPEAVFADCGKMRIHPHYFPRPPRPPKPRLLDCPPVYPIPQQPPIIVPDYGQGSQLQQTQEQILNNANSNSTNITLNNNVGTVPAPELAPEPTGGAVYYGDKDSTFAEPGQKALIAWNGKSDDNGEETLILITDEVSKTGQKMAMLSVLPLPGKPLEIERANARAFVEAQILLDKKFKQKSIANTFGVVMYKKIGAHNIFVWELDNITTFKEEVTAYVADKYNNAATALITDKTSATVKKYFDKGFRYFAFDLTEVDTKVSTKEAIAYRFKTKFAYYPLAISAIGGTGRSYVDLVVMTPGQIRLTKDFEDETKSKNVKVRVIGNTSVDFTMDEVKSLDPKLSKVFDSNQLNSVTVRNFGFAIEDIGDFGEDFGAVAPR